MLFIGIDPSLSRTGIVVLNEKAKLLHASALSVGEAARPAQRLRLLQSALGTVLDSLDTTSNVINGDRRVCIEGPNLNAPNPATLFALGECVGVIKASLRGLGDHEPVIVAPVQLKKFATNKTGQNADKAAVLHAVKTTWDQDFGDEDDIADAYVLARIAWAMNSEAFKRRCEADVVYALLGRSAEKAKKRPPRLRERRTDNL